MPIDRSAITRIRESYPLTKTELAERVGVSRNSIIDIESGKTAQPRPATVRAIAEVLGVPVSKFWLEASA